MRRIAGMPPVFLFFNHPSQGVENKQSTRLAGRRLRLLVRQKDITSNSCAVSGLVLGSK